MKKLALAIIFFVALLTSQLFSYSQELVLKKRLAVIDFIDGTEGTSKSAAVRTADDKFDTRQATVTSSNYSKVLVTMLTTELVKSGVFTVIERQQLEAILDEKKLANNGIITRESAMTLNKVSGIQLLVTGSITEYGVKLANKQSSFGAYFGKSKAKSTARISLDLRVLNASSGEILMAETASGSAVANSGGLQVMGIGSVSAVDDNTLLDSALRKAVVNCVNLIKKAAVNIIWEGSVIKANADGTVFIKPGSNGGVKEGMTFFVFKKGEDIKDPDTGLSLGNELKKIGSITIISDIGEGKAAKARINSGTGVVSAGDVIKL